MKAYHNSNVEYQTNKKKLNSNLKQPAGFFTAVALDMAVLRVEIRTAKGNPNVAVLLRRSKQQIFTMIPRVCAREQIRHSVS